MIFLGVKYPLRSGWGALDRSSCGAPFRVATPGQHRRRAIPARSSPRNLEDRSSTGRSPAAPNTGAIFLPVSKNPEVRAGGGGLQCSVFSRFPHFIQFFPSHMHSPRDASFCTFITLSALTFNLRHFLQSGVCPECTLSNGGSRHSTLDYYAMFVHSRTTQWHWLQSIH